MKIPKKIKVGSHNYDVVMTKSNDGERGVSNWGKADRLHGRILIDKDICKAQLEETFIHETLHCLMAECKVGYELDNEKKLTEEDVVNRLAPVLCNFLNDNKI